ncbi:toll/interleukin-1 receptor domain-containing protein [Bacteroides sp. ET489]|uniref:toll/interleukin-1 receptor domain-containing protein n=1 Tax=Bacteroidaceae TaxID=815 RepID=UPI0019597713|nr:MULTISPECIES: toll/interleukin-1 receptor domain-containing protein [Bacteroides]MBM6718430.1 toll/interleukin-1 receptor domain-containing protein [Bacteroides gallinaceum]MDO3391932.1 toll/interleukin-1 receptor domain-containing protein [Bacteroides sp. ET489]
MNIFISYTIKDKEISFDSLSSISRKLKHIGNVYIDIINNDSINKQERVFYELDNSDIVMLLITPNVYKSKWVIIELERAKERSIPIISFTLKEIETLNINSISRLFFNKLKSNLIQKIPVQDK